MCLSKSTRIGDPTDHKIKNKRREWSRGIKEKVRLNPEIKRERNDTKMVMFFK
jgi:hypothetical protein